MSALRAAGIVVAIVAGIIGAVTFMPRGTTTAATFPADSPSPSPTMPPNGWVRRIRIGEVKPVRYSASAAIELWSDCADNGVATVSMSGSIAERGTTAKVIGRRIGSCHVVAYALDGWQDRTVRAVLTIEVAK